MRAKRSKKYRKLMHQYELTFGFREPYQVLVDSNFLRAIHQFKMDLIPSLERTLKGKVKPLLSKCSLAAIMAAQPKNPKTNNPIRPEHLPPPTTLPLRHCSHNEEDTPIDEAECLLSLLCPNKETMRNKEHYILATADPPSAEVLAQNPQVLGQNGELSNPKKRKRAEILHQELSRKASALRAGARSIPGVPIIYVKRSVMILEPMSTPSEQVRLGVEESKFKAGIETALSVVGKRKRDENDEGPKPRRAKKAKGPNPLSVKKPKKREKQRPEDQGKKNKKSSENSEQGTSNGPGAEGEATVKTKRKRRHKSSKAAGDKAGGENNNSETVGAEPAASDSKENAAD
ncbi:hypothetical protein VTN96DRAFT_1080 [Rasamsonia emersonii]|uniref:rRNA processing protein n=1 Tax=Rasamsonia emersonii (strain ATCC 16479 / CBS 393.64 / IMI 116815) TaxID=1408163 RepID=A0A0F4YMH3_RASE3|nr:RRNA processing protein [Rasamsonia emersonii CBS 393.64]KKA19295.1 RRNA processing protein [Rasamsonia emersonii CBS 393.64]